jgi:hypothetical protein
MENTCNYSDDWQPYIGDYDKFEYDVKLKNGTIVENCYPNAGKFNSISDEHNQMQFNETDVVEIRFSEKPRFALNCNVSERPQFEWLNRQRRDLGVSSTPFYDEELHFEYINYHNLISNYDPFIGHTPKWARGKVVKPVRDSKVDPKIQRNNPCPCGSEKKYKKCCGVNS